MYSLQYDISYPFMLIKAILDSKLYDKIININKYVWKSFKEINEKYGVSLP